MPITSNSIDSCKRDDNSVATNGISLLLESWIFNGISDSDFIFQSKIKCRWRMTSPLPLCMGSHTLADSALFLTAWTMCGPSIRTPSIFLPCQLAWRLLTVVFWSRHGIVKWQSDRKSINQSNNDNYKRTWAKALSRTARKIPSTPQSTPNTTPGDGMWSNHSITSSHKFTVIGLEMKMERK